MCADNAVRVTGLEPGQRLRAVNEGRCIIGHSQHEGFNGRFAHFHEQLVKRDLPFQFTVRPQTHSKKRYANLPDCCPKDTRRGRLLLWRELNSQVLAAGTIETGHKCQSNRLAAGVFHVEAGRNPVRLDLNGSSGRSEDAAGVRRS